MESTKILKHKQYFQDQVKFKNVLEINDESILHKIHLNHRLVYLRDTAIGRFIEETTLKNINILVHYNNSDIVQYFLSNKFYLKDLANKMISNNLEEANDAILYMLELINVSKDLLQTRQFFYETLCELNFIEIIEKLLEKLKFDSEFDEFLHKSSNNLASLVNLDKEASKKNIYIKEGSKITIESLKINTIEILVNMLPVVPRKFLCLNINLDHLKNYIIDAKQKEKEYPLLTELCNIFITQENFGIKYEVINQKLIFV